MQLVISHTKSSSLEHLKAQYQDIVQIGLKYMQWLMVDHKVKMFGWYKTKFIFSNCKGTIVCISCKMLMLMSINDKPTNSTKIKTCFLDTIDRFALNEKNLDASAHTFETHIACLVLSFIPSLRVF